MAIGATAFQPNAFQTNPLAFQIASGPVVAPNVPGGAIIYAIGEPASQRPTTIASFNPSNQVSLRSPNPTIFFYVGDSLTNAQQVTLQLTTPSGLQSSFPQNVFPGTGNPFTPVGMFQPGFYAVYVFGPGDLPEFGTYSASIAWTDQAGTSRTSGVAQFYVAP
jgi:hypothetical protein